MTRSPAARSRRLGLLGGTLDPVHYGHLDAADAALAALALDEVLVVPSHLPPHRPDGPHASAFHRFALVALAVTDRPRLRVSDMELRREGPSYSIATLEALHADGWQPDELFFIIGADAFADVAQWRAFPAVLDAANFVVIARPGHTVAPTIARATAARAEHRARNGRASVGRPTTGLFPVDAVTRNVSSTAVRTRLAAGGSIDDMVPPAVARHILSHHLYGAVDHLHGQDERA